MREGTTASSLIVNQESLALVGSRPYSSDWHVPRCREVSSGVCCDHWLGSGAKAVPVVDRDYLIALPAQVFGRPVMVANNHWQSRFSQDGKGVGSSPVDPLCPGTGGLEDIATVVRSGIQALVPLEETGP